MNATQAMRSAQAERSDAPARPWASAAVLVGVFAVWLGAAVFVVGLPAAGTVQEVSATPIERVRALTRVPSSPNCSGSRSNRMVPADAPGPQSTVCGPLITVSLS